MKKKLNVAVLFGGRSGEHEVSIASANSIFKALNKEKYEVQLIGIDKVGRWTSISSDRFLAHSANPRSLDLAASHNTQWPVAFPSAVSMIDVDQVGSETAGKKFDVVFPVLHGTYGEDGTLQGLLELSQLPYVGSGVLGSAVGMDKDISRRLLSLAGIPVVPTRSYRAHEFAARGEQILEEILADFGFPYFVKPANMGSSVGVAKVRSAEEAPTKIAAAFQFDTKILIEKAVDARELEVSILGNHQPKVSVIGEIIPTHEFYSYEAKYLDENGASLKIPAEDLSPELKARIPELAIRAFQALECCGLARVDFFLDRQTNELFLNEINTMPGFTNISMYPKLWEASGVPYAELLDHLIELALEKHREKAALKTSI